LSTLYLDQWFLITRRLSNVLQKYVNAAISGKEDPAKALNEAQIEVEKIISSMRLIPKMGVGSDEEEYSQLQI